MWNKHRIKQLTESQMKQVLGGNGSIDNCNISITCGNGVQLSCSGSYSQQGEIGCVSGSTEQNGQSHAYISCNEGNGWQTTSCPGVPLSTLEPAI